MNRTLAPAPIPLRVPFALAALLLSGALSGDAVEAQAGQGELKGMVLTEESGRPVPGIEIRFRDGPSVLTNRNGEYRAGAMAAGMREFALVTARCQVAFGTARVGLEGDWTTNLSLPESMASAHRTARSGNDPRLILNAADLDEIPARTLADVLRRELPDMVIGVPGQPGQWARVEGRNRATVTGSTTPLFVVDGIRLGNTPEILWDLSPGDVAAVEVLRGASGGWSYGTGASGGVILIHTKKGMGATVGAPSNCQIPEWGEEGA